MLSPTPLWWGSWCQWRFFNDLRLQYQGPTFRYEALADATITHVIDDLSDDLSTAAGAFTDQANVVDAFNSNHAYNSFGTAGDVARYEFSDLANGTYDVFATWRQNGQSNLGSANYTVSDGGGVYTADQTLPPMADMLLPDSDAANMHFFNFEKMTQVTIDDGTIQVDLQAVGNNYILTDAVAVRLVPEPSSIVMLLVGLAGLVSMARRR